MTSETLYYLEAIKSELVRLSSTFPDGFIFVFKDSDGQLYYRPDASSQELERFAPDDNQGNYFYIEFRERENGTITPDQPRLASCQERQLESYPFRIVAIFRDENMWEVLDKLKYDLLSVFMPDWGNADTPKILQEKFYLDWLNTSDNDTAGLLRNYEEGLLSCAIEFSLTYFRSVSCRQPEDKIN